MAGEQLRMLLLDDYEGQLAAAPAMPQLRTLADVIIQDRPLTAGDHLVLQESTGHYCSARATGNPTDSGCPGTRLWLNAGVDAQDLSVDNGHGEWLQSIGGTVAGRTLGILGYGRHGRPIARIAAAFGMKIVVWNSTGAAKPDEPSIQRLALDKLSACADVVSIHLHLSDESRGLLNRERRARMKPTALLINWHSGFRDNSPAEVLNPAAIEIPRQRSGSLTSLDKARNHKRTHQPGDNVHRR